MKNIFGQKLILSMMSFFAVATVSTSAIGSAFGGNGVERYVANIVNFDNFNIPLEVKQRVNAELAVACPSLYEVAKSAGPQMQVTSVQVIKDSVDQGVIDYVYDINLAIPDSSAANAEFAKISLKRWAISNPAIDPFTSLGLELPEICQK